MAVFGTAGPSPGSLEGVYFTKLPLRLHLFGLPEVCLQTLLFSAGLVTWCRRPARWKNVASGIFLALVVLMSVAGVLAAKDPGSEMLPKSAGLYLQLGAAQRSV